MTLREWVEASAQDPAFGGTRRELEAFETGLLEAWARAAARGRPTLPINDASVPAVFWSYTFNLTRGLLAKVGAPLGRKRRQR